MRPHACPLALALVLLLAAPLVKAAESVSIVESRTFVDAPAVPHASHDLLLHAYTFRGARWLPDEIVNAVVESARLLAQCAVALAGAELRIVEAPRRFHDYFTPVSRELLRAIDAPRPALFFVEDTRNRPAFDAEAIGVQNSRGRKELANTVWVAHGARDLPQALAHELVHVLSDSGEHVNEAGNLMRDETSPHNTRLTAAQCARLRSRGEANGLLRQRDTLK